MKTLSKELREKLICAKYLFSNGLNTLTNAGPFSAGIALLSFQDSVEMTMSVIAEHWECNIKERTPFNGILDQVEGITGKILPCKSSFTQMNKARVNFKHYGLEPKQSTVVKFRNDIEEYYPRIYKEYLNIDYSSISLIDLIKHRRTENYLHASQDALDCEDYEESVAQSAFAFAIYLRYHDDSRGIGKLAVRNFRDSEIQQLAERVEKAIDVIQMQINLVMDGLNLANYRKFIRCTPQVFQTISGKCEPHYPMFGERVEANKEVAMFCHQFVIDAAITMRNNKIPPRFPYRVKKRSFRVKKSSTIRTYYDSDSEVIRDAKIGEILAARDTREDIHEYIAILQDGDTAYILSEAVEEIPLRESKS